MLSLCGFGRLVPSLGISSFVIGILTACSGGSEGLSDGMGGAATGGLQAAGGATGGGGAHSGGATSPGSGGAFATAGAGGGTTTGGAGSGGKGQGGAGTGGSTGSGGTVPTLDASPADSALDSADAASDGAANDLAAVADSGPAKADASAPIDGNEACVVSVAGPFGVRSAHSAGYQGTLAAYSDLYNVACTSIDPCISSCVAAGGTTESCTYGSECVQGINGMHCLPPTYWRYEDRATAADGETAEQTLVKIAYQDPLLVRDFAVDLPSDAVIRGIAFDVLRGSNAQAVAVDFAVRVLRAGQPVGDDKKRGTSWPSSLTYVTYGGPTDTWGVSWSAADLTSPGFGLSLAVAYTDTAGNARAYVDYARVSIYYSTGCQ